MLEEGPRCDQILIQVMAARAALEKVAAVVATNVEECLTLPPDEARKALGASIGMLTRM